MAQVASRERRSSTSSTSSNSSSGSRSPRVQYRSFWAILEPLPPRSPTRTSSHSALPKSPSLSNTKQAHRQHVKTPPATPTKSLGKPINSDILIAGLEDRKVREHEQKVQQLIGPTKSLTIQVPILPKGRVIIHCLRHAQAQHNIATIPRPQRLAILDPQLTSHGRVQATQLRKTLGASQNVTHVLCSPLKRTLQTALIGLSPMLSSAQKLIAYPDLREWGSSPCSTGSKMRDLLLEMKEKQENVDFALVEKGWEVNREDRGSLSRKERVRRVREDLFLLGQESLKEKGTWKGKNVGRGLESGRNVEIILVSHAAFLGTLEGTDIERLRNAQWRTYEFASEEEIRTKKYSPCSLVETRESKRRNDPVISPSKEPPPSPKKPTAEKAKDSSKAFILDEAALIAKKLNVEIGKENINPCSSKDNTLLGKEVNLESADGKLRPCLEETASGSNKLNTNALDKLNVAENLSLNLRPANKLDAPLRVTSPSTEVLVTKPQIQLPVTVMVLATTDKLQISSVTGSQPVAQQMSPNSKKVETEVLKPVPVVHKILLAPNRDDKTPKGQTAVTLPLPNSTPTPLSKPVELLSTLKNSQLEKSKANLPAVQGAFQKTSENFDEKYIKLSLVSDPSSVNGESFPIMQNQVAMPTKLPSTVRDTSPKPKKLQVEVSKDKQKSPHRSSSPEASPKILKSSRTENLRVTSPVIESNVSSMGKLQNKTPKETLEPSVEMNVPNPDKIHPRKSKDKLKSSRTLDSDGASSGPKRLHRKKSKELLKPLPEEAPTTLSPKRSHPEKSRDKLQTPAENTSGPKKLHSERSKDKLKSSRSRSSAPDEIPLTLRRLFAEMSREKMKRSPSPEPISTPSSPKKLHSERSKDKLKGQKRHLLG